MFDPHPELDNPATLREWLLSWDRTPAWWTAVRAAHLYDLQRTQQLRLELDGGPPDEQIEADLLFAQRVMDHGEGRTVRRKLYHGEIEDFIGRGVQKVEVRSRHIGQPLSRAWIFEILSAETDIYGRNIQTRADCAENIPFGYRPATKLLIQSGEAVGELWADWIVDIGPPTSDDLEGPALTQMPTDVWERAHALYLASTVVVTAALGQDIHGIRGGVGDFRLPPGDLGEVRERGLPLDHQHQITVIAAAVRSVRDHLAEQGQSVPLQEHAVAALAQGARTALIDWESVDAHLADRDAAVLLGSEAVQSLIDEIADLIQYQRREKPGSWMQGEDLSNPGGVRGIARTLQLSCLQ